MFRGETSVHAGNGSRRNATSHGNDTASYIIDAYSDTKSCSVPKVKRIRNEYTSTINSEASLEATEGLGRFRKMLRTHTTTEFRGYFTTSPGTVSRGVKDG